MSTYSCPNARNQWAGVPTRPGTFVSVEELPNTTQLNPEEELLALEELGFLLIEHHDIYRFMAWGGIDPAYDDPLVVLTERLAAQR